MNLQSNLILKDKIKVNESQRLKIIDQISKYEALTGLYLDFFPSTSDNLEKKLNLKSRYK